MEQVPEQVGPESNASSAYTDPGMCEKLVVASVQAALASIEIYNKPVFSYREEAFTILLINAWESLCKARQVSNSKGDVRVLYIQKSDGSYKKGRSGNFLTLDLVAAINGLGLADQVSKNLLALIEIRDTATHLYAEPAVQQLVHSLGVAALRNYYKLLTSWFGNRLSGCGFQIMPIAFTYDFRTLTVLALADHSADISRLVKLVASQQNSTDSSDGFYFVCEIAAEIRSVKKLNDLEGIKGVLDPSSVRDHPVAIRTQSLVDKYPLSYMQLRASVLAQVAAKPAQVDGVIRQFKMKDDPAFAAYNYRTKAHRENSEKTGKVPKGTPAIYNAEAVRFIVAKIQETPEAGLYPPTLQ